MIQRYVKVGEHTVLVKTSSDLIRNWLTSQFDQVEPISTSSDLVISICEGYGLPFMGFSVEIKSDVNQISYERADYKVTVDTNYSEAQIYVYDTFALKHALMNLYSAFIIHHDWGLLVHSSCVVEDNAAVLFAGDSGAGKSTVAKLSAPRLLLSNEATIVKVTHEEAAAVNSFPFRSDPGVFSKHSYNLDSIYLLHQSDEVLSVDISRSEGLPKLIDKVFYWAHDSAETQKLIRLIVRLLKHVSLHDLYFQKSNSFWNIIQNECMERLLVKNGDFT